MVLVLAFRLFERAVSEPDTRFHFYGTGSTENHLRGPPAVPTGRPGTPKSGIGLPSQRVRKQSSHIPASLTQRDHRKKLIVRRVSAGMKSDGPSALFLSHCAGSLVVSPSKRYTKTETFALPPQSANMFCHVVNRSEPRPRRAKTSCRIGYCRTMPRKEWLPLPFTEYSEVEYIIAKSAVRIRIETLRSATRSRPQALYTDIVSASPQSSLWRFRSLTWEPSSRPYPDSAWVFARLSIALPARRLHLFTKEQWYTRGKFAWVLPSFNDVAVTERPLSERIRPSLRLYTASFSALTPIRSAPSSESSTCPEWDFFTIEERNRDGDKKIAGRFRPAKKLI